MLQSLSTCGLRESHPSSNTLLVVGTIGVVSGVALVVLAACSGLGPIGTPGAIAGLGGGGAIALLSSALIVKAVCDRRKPHPNPPVPIQPIIPTDNPDDTLTRFPSQPPVSGSTRTAASTDEGDQPNAPGAQNRPASSTAPVTISPPPPLRPLSSSITLPPITSTPERQLQKLTADINLPISICQIKQPPERITHYAQHAIFYGYNAEGIQDYGWGCAWRAIQTCLSSLCKPVTFETLFHTFGPLEHLQAIYTDKYRDRPTNDLVTTGVSFAPYTIPNGWAEPFIGEMAMHYYGIPASLESLHFVPHTCYTPHAVFTKQPLNFSAFRDRLITHFQQESAAPVMIDNAIYALTIIGVGVPKDSQDITLWIADPHLERGVNKTSTDRNGLFTVTLAANGSYQRSSLTEAHAKQLYHGMTRATILDFAHQPWMVLFPGEAPPAT